MKKIFKYLLYILLFLVVVVLLLPVVLYMPAVQRYALERGLAYVRDSFRMEARVDRFSLDFPFDIRMEHLFLGKTAQDTLAYAENLHIEIGLSALLRRAVAVRQLQVQGAKVDWVNDSTGMRVLADLRELGVESALWRFGAKRVAIWKVGLTGGRVDFTGGTVAVPDTASVAGFDWELLARLIELRDVEYRMRMESLPFFQANLEEGVMQSGRIDLGKQQIRVREVELTRGICSMELASGIGTPSADVPVPVTGDTTGDWTVEADRVSLEGFAFDMTGLSEGKVEIKLVDIGLTLKEVYNRGMTVRAGLEDLRLVRPPGGEITEMKAEVDLDTTHTRLTGLLLRTPHSSLRLDATAGTGVTDLPGKAPLAVNLTGTVGAGDVRLFWPEAPAGWQELRVDADAVYRPDDLRVSQLDIRIPGVVSLSANGQLFGFTPLEKLNGQVRIQATTRDPAFWRPFVGEAMTVPSGLSLAGDIEASEGTVRPRIRLSRNGGSADLDGSYSLSSERYTLHVKTEAFDLGAFLPDQQLGAFTAELQLRGNGWQPERAWTGLLLELENGVYRQHDYNNIRLIAHLREAHLEGALQSRDSAALLGLRFDVDFRESRYSGRVKGEVRHIDLQTLHLTDSVMRFALDLNVEGVSGGDTLSATVRIDSLRLDEGRGFYDLGTTEIDLKSDPGQTTAGVASGDLHATFRADAAITTFADRIGSVARTLQTQITERKIAVQQLSDTLPFFRMELKSGTRNPAGIWLDTKGIWFRSLYAEAGNERGKGVYARVEAEDPMAGSMGADTLVFALDQQGSEVDYSLQVYEPQGLPGDFYDLQLSGRLHADTVEAAFRQRNRKEQAVVEVGTVLTMHDSSFDIKLFPENPVFGYTEWSLNENNRITLYTDHRIRAGLLLSSGEKQFRLQSQENTEGVPDKLQLQVQKIDLAALSAWLPLLPQWTGIVNMDVLVYEEAGEVIGTGSAGVDQFFYEQKKVGDIRLEGNYRGGEHFSRHMAGLKLALDGKPFLTADGEVLVASGDSSLRADVNLTSLPLQAVSAFMPDGSIELRGALSGDLHVRGSVRTPEMDGGLSFRNARVIPAALGTSFAVDSSRVPLRNGQLEFRNFSLSPANNQPMRINGTVAFTPFDRMRADLSVSARNFQAVNVRSNPNSLLFGKAYTDVNLTVKGLFTALALDGNIRVLNNTDVTYVLRNDAPELRDRSVDLVRFLSFDDTLRLQRREAQQQNSSSSFSMKLYVDIGEAVHANINLSEEGDDQIQIQGGGNLIFAMSPEEGNNLSGRYSLNGGSVRYGIPVVGTKVFDIRNGSYLEWAGALDNPNLNIVAGESVRVSVTEANQNSRLVNFTALIRIEGALDRPQVTFDLDAPNDQEIRNQLAAFSAEERTRQSMNLLVYGAYSGPGTVSTGNSANNTLNNFIASELNQWSRKYLGDVGLTFGIDSYNQIGEGGQEVSRTDYSYQFSKHLFNDRVNVKIGGRVSTDGEPGSGMEQNLVDDVAIEYALTQNRNWFLKAFRQTNYESVLEGEVTQTGAGVLLRRSFNRVRDLFVRRSKRPPVEMQNE